MWPLDKHRRRLKLVAADLGAVRDLDVLIEAAELYQAGLAGPEARAFDALAPVMTLMQGELEKLARA